MVSSVDLEKDRTRTREIVDFWFEMLKRMTMKSGKEQITGFTKCIIFHSNISQLSSWAAYICRLCVLWLSGKNRFLLFFLFETEKKCTSVPQVKWNQQCQKQPTTTLCAACTHTLTEKKRQRTNALIWFDGWCVKIHGFCYCIWFPFFSAVVVRILYNVRPSASTSILNLVALSQCIHLNVLSKCSTEE